MSCRSYKMTRDSRCNYTVGFTLTKPNFHVKYKNNSDRFRSIEYQRVDLSRTDRGESEILFHGFDVHEIMEREIEIALNNRRIYSGDVQEGAGGRGDLAPVLRNALKSEKLGPRDRKAGLIALQRRAIMRKFPLPP